MNWLAFLIGALFLGFLLYLLINYILDPNRKTAKAALQEKLELSNRENVSLKTQMTGYQGMQTRLDSAKGEIDALKVQVGDLKDLKVRLDGANSQIAAQQMQLTGMKDLQARLNGANVELDSLRAQVGDLKDMKVRLDGANSQIAGLQTQLAGMKDLQARVNVANTELDSLRAQVGRMQRIQADLDTCQTKTAQQNAEIDRLNKELAAFASAKSIAQSSTPDDLTIIEGIGLKISELLNQNGIHTFAELAAASVVRLQAILNTGGPRFSVADPETWPEQAILARDGKWDAFKALTDTLTGGRRTE